MSVFSPQNSSSRAAVFASSWHYIEGILITKNDELFSLLWCRTNDTAADVVVGETKRHQDSAHILSIEDDRFSYTVVNSDIHFRSFRQKSIKSDFYQKLTYKVLPKW